VIYFANCAQKDAYQCGGSTSQSSASTCGCGTFSSLTGTITNATGGMSGCNNATVTFTPSGGSGSTGYTSNTIFCGCATGSFILTGGCPYQLTSSASVFGLGTGTTVSCSPVNIVINATVPAGPCAGSTYTLTITS
jgi:hypothetical protein